MVGTTRTRRILDPEIEAKIQRYVCQTPQRGQWLCGEIFEVLGVNPRFRRA
jgi:hypothetical protein